MSCSTLLYLCDELRSGIEKQNTIMRRAVSTEKRVVLTLCFLATGADYRTIGHLLDVHVCIEAFLGFLLGLCGGDSTSLILCGIKSLCTKSAKGSPASTSPSVSRSRSSMAIYRWVTLARCNYVACANERARVRHVLINFNFMYLSCASEIQIRRLWSYNFNM